MTTVANVKAHLQAQGFSQAAIEWAGRSIGPNDEVRRYIKQYVGRQLRGWEIIYDAGCRQFLAERQWAASAAENVVQMPPQRRSVQPPPPPPTNGKDVATTVAAATGAASGRAHCTAASGYDRDRIAAFGGDIMDACGWLDEQTGDKMQAVVEAVQSLREGLLEFPTMSDRVAEDLHPNAPDMDIDEIKQIIADVCDAPPVQPPPASSPAIYEEPKQPRGRDSWPAKRKRVAGAKPARQPQNDKDEPMVNVVRFSQPSNKPVIQVTAGNLHVAATDGENCLIKADEQIFVRGGSIVRAVIEETDAADNRKTTTARFTGVKVPGIRDYLSRVATWQKWSDTKRAWINIDPPKDVAEIILSRVGEWKLRRVSGVITTPTLRPDGSILRDEGYDPETGLILLSPPQLPDMPEHPTKEDAIDALAVLSKLLTEFVFVNEESRAVAVSSFITPVVRGMLATSPLHVNTAPVVSSGKSYLPDLSSAIVTGKDCPIVPRSNSLEELEKRLCALLLKGVPLISLDNVNGALASELLCSLLTNPSVEIRILGTLNTILIDSRACIFANGRNIQIADDLYRRTLLCSLDPKVERPELRTFEHNPKQMILAARGKYIAACMTIVRAYMCVGSPDKLSPLNSYEDWSLRVRSALVWLGMKDPVKTQIETRGEDQGFCELAAVMHAWKDSHLSADEFVSTADLIKAAVSSSKSDLREALLAVAVAKDGNHIDSRRLGCWLRTHKGRFIRYGTEQEGGTPYNLRIVAVKNSHTEQPNWKLEVGA